MHRTTWGALNSPIKLHFEGLKLVLSIWRRLRRFRIWKKLYLRGAECVAMYPVSTLPPITALNVTACSYAGTLYFGLIAGRTAIPDLAVLTSCLDNAFVELARAAGQDPLAFRIAHLQDSRAIALLKRLAAVSGWSDRPPPGSGERPLSATATVVAETVIVFSI